MTPRAGQQPAPASDADRAATLQLIIALGRALQALERAVGPHLVQQGLSLTEFAVLEVLYHKGALRLGEIRDRILLTGASTTYVVKKLEERGLMRRRACAEDSRVVFGELTAKGRALIDEVFPAHVERLQRAMSGSVGVAKARRDSTAANPERACAPSLGRTSHGRGLRPESQNFLSRYLDF